MNNWPTVGITEEIYKSGSIPRILEFMGWPATWSLAMCLPLVVLSEKASCHFLLLLTSNLLVLISVCGMSYSEHVVISYQVTQMCCLSFLNVFVISS